jgi:hypothetical protein
MPMMRIVPEALALPLLLAVAFFFVMRWRLRRTGYTDWYDRWKQIERPRRERIEKAVRRGEAVDDPNDAVLAMELIEQSTGLRKLGGTGDRPLWRRIGLPVLIVGLGLAAGLGVLAFAPVAIFAALELVAKLSTRGVDERVARARRANEALLPGITSRPENERRV